MTTAFRLLFLALLLSLALGQGCFAASPAIGYGVGLNYGPMSPHECVRWSAHALEELGYTSITPDEDRLLVTAYKDPRSAAVICSAAPSFHVVFNSNISGTDAGNEMNAFLHRVERMVHEHGWEHRH